VALLLGPTDPLGNRQAPAPSFWPLVSAIGVLLPFVVWGYYDNRGGTEGKAAFVAFLCALIASISCLLPGRAIVILQRKPSRRRVGVVVAISGLVAIWLVTYVVSMNLIRPLLMAVPNASAALTNAAKRTIATEFATPEITSCLAAAIGIRALGREQVSASVRRTEGAVQDTLNSQGEDTPRQRGEREYIAAIQKLWTTGPIYPRHNVRQEIDTRLALLLHVYHDLSRVSEALEGDQAYVTLLHGRFMVARAAVQIAGRSGEVISQAQLVDLSHCVEESADLVHKAAHRDGFIYFDDIGSSYALTGDFKTGFAKCSDALGYLPASTLCGADSLRLRFHILRLQLFAWLCEESRKVDPSGQTASEIARFARDAKGESAIDASLTYIRMFQSRNQAAAETASLWIDTLLVGYSRLGAYFRDSPPWDLERLRTMVLEQTTQSQKLLQALMESEELSPDYIEASLYLHKEAIRLWDRKKDKTGLRTLIEHGRKYLAVLSTGSGVLYTPLRTAEPSKDDGFDSDGMREFFDGQYRQLEL
jgi:hypothetical protein